VEGREEVARLLAALGEELEGEAGR
jgi:hypothetical protein